VSLSRITVEFEATGLKAFFKRLKDMKQNPLKHKDVREGIFQKVKGDIVKSNAAGKSPIDGTKHKSYSTSMTLMPQTQAGNKIRMAHGALKPVKLAKPKRGKGNFKEYKDGEGYRAYKASTHGDDTPNLRNKGSMIDSISHKKQGRGMIIFPKGAANQQAGIANIVLGRRWFGFSKASVEFIKKILVDFIINPRKSKRRRRSKKK